MDHWLTVGTAWLAMGCYFAAAGSWLSGFKESRARGFWTAGFLAYSAHVACAFGLYHDWSHDRAYADTAKQTADLFGWDWGGGLYFNYAFTVAWAADVVGWWWCGARRLPRRLEFVWQGFFLLMVANATVVFGTGWSRWGGVAGLAGCGVIALVRRRHLQR